MQAGPRNSRCLPTPSGEVSIHDAESCCVNASSEVGYALACPPPERSSPRAASRHDGVGKLKHTPPIGADTSVVVYSEVRTCLDRWEPRRGVKGEGGSRPVACTWP